MRAIAAFALTAAIAGVATAYPLIAPERTALERAAIAQAFRARNREHWITVDVDSRGFVNHIITDDPNLVPSAAWTTGDLERIRSFLRGNVDLTGIGPRVIDEVQHDGILLFGQHGARLAELSLDRDADPGQPPRLEIRTRFEIPAVPTVTPEQVSARLAGTTVTELAGYGRGRTMFTRTRSVKLRSDDVHTRSYIHADGDRVRIVYCSEPRVDALPPDPSWGDVALTEQTFEPGERIVIDAVTGEHLRLTVGSCRDVANVRE